MPLKLLERGPVIIAALHLPEFRGSRYRSVSWLQDYTITNARIFAEAGIPWIKLQDQTQTNASAAPETLALMAALGQLIRRELPQLGLGIIIEAHDPQAALSIAYAVGADFVRLKVFVGGAMTAAGPRYGLGAKANEYRASLRADEIAILADVHDRTSRPLSDESQPFAAHWAVKTGADCLVITGSSFPDTLERISAVRAKVPGHPVFIGGGVTKDNVRKAMSAADGLIVSSTLMRPDAQVNDIVQWDADRCRRFMEASGAI